jgi:hypothetical protein
VVGAALSSELSFFGADFFFAGFFLLAARAQAPAGSSLALGEEPPSTFLIVVSVMVASVLV